MSEQQNKKENNSAYANFFKLTSEKLSANLEKYDTVRKNNPTYLLGANAVEPLDVGYKKRLNSMDSSMLEDIAYTVLDDENLKLEKKIENTEKILKELTEKLIVADAIENDTAKEELLRQRKFLLLQRKNLMSRYRKQGFGANFSSVYSRLCSFPQFVSKKIRKFIKNFVRHSVLLKKFTPLMRAITVRDTLSRLNKINKSVDELVNMKVPFGEQDEKYEALIMHLSRAGALHNQIKKELNGR